MSQSSSELIYQRVTIVDQVMREKGWNPGVANELALTLGITRRSVYRLRNMALSWTRKQLRPTDVERWRTQQVQLADEGARMALRKEDASGLAAILKVSGLLTGTIAPAGKVDVHLNNSTTYNAAVAMVSNLSIEEQAAQVDRLIAEKRRIEAVEVESVVVPTDVPPR